MGSLESQLQEISAAYASELDRGFPYEDVRRLQAEHALEFQKLSPTDSLNADLNEYCSFVAGLATGGLKAKLKDPITRTKIVRLLKQSFFDRYAQYRFVQRIDLSAYPDLNAEFLFIDRLRRVLLEAITEAKQSLPRTTKPKEYQQWSVSEETNKYSAGHNKQKSAVQIVLRVATSIMHAFTMNFSIRGKKH